MANFAKLEMTWTANFELDKNLRFTFVNNNRPVGDPLREYEILERCRNSRTQSGEFKYDPFVDTTLNNLRDAIQADFVDAESAPFEVFYNATTNTITCIATEYTFQFTTPTYTGDNADFSYVLTLEQEPNPQGELICTRVDFSQSDIDCIHNAKRTFILDPAAVGVPPYRIIDPLGAVVKTAANEAELFLDVDRSIGSDSADNFIIKDSNDLVAETSFGGVTYYYDYPFNLTYTPNQDGSATWGGYVQFNQIFRASTYLPIMNIEVRNRDTQVVLDSFIWRADDNSKIDLVGKIITPAQPIAFYATDELCDTDFLLAEFDIPVLQVSFQYMLSNSLHFTKVNSDEYQNPLNRTHCQLSQQNGLKIPYAQKYLQTSDLWVQFQTENEITAYLIDEQGVEVDISSFIEPVKLIGTTKWENLVPDITNLEGVYQIRVEFAGQDPMLSNRFEVVKKLNRYIKVQWYNTGINYGYQDGMEWNNRLQEMIIEGDYIDSVSSVDKSVLTDTNNRLVNLKSYAGIQDKYEIFKATKDMIERLNLGLNHYKFFVNGIEYQSEDAQDFNRFVGTFLKYGELELRRVEYEIY